MVYLSGVDIIRNAINMQQILRMIFQRYFEGILVSCLSLSPGFCLAHMGTCEYFIPRSPCFLVAKVQGVKHPI